jgi:hypothetical protein
VREDLLPVRVALRGVLTDLDRLKLKDVRDALGFDRPEWQANLAFNIAFVSGGLSRVLVPTRVALVNRLERAALTISDAAADFCRVTGIDVPRAKVALDDLADLAGRLAAPPAPGQ